MFRKKIKLLDSGKKYFLLILVVILFSGSCQRDDICSAATQTTPMLLISFYDEEDPETPKPATNLIVRELSYDTLIYNRENAEEIRIPLRVDTSTTEYEFILNAPADDEDEDESNIDRITFSYNPEEIYISRACSFKVNFRDLEVQINEDDIDIWINSFTIEEDNIENETSAHIIIYH